MTMMRRLSNGQPWRSCRLMIDSGHPSSRVWKVVRSSLKRSMSLTLACGKDKCSSIASSKSLKKTMRSSLTSSGTVSISMRKIINQYLVLLMIFINKRASCVIVLYSVPYNATYLIVYHITQAVSISVRNYALYFGLILMY